MFVHVGVAWLPWREAIGADCGAGGLGEPLFGVESGFGASSTLELGPTAKQQHILFTLSSGPFLRKIWAEGFFKEGSKEHTMGRIELNYQEVGIISPVLGSKVFEMIQSMYYFLSSKMCYVFLLNKNRIHLNFLNFDYLLALLYIKVLRNYCYS